MTSDEHKKIQDENIKNILEGRPTKYRPEYCEMLIDFVGKQGFSYEAFAGYIGVHKDTLYEWEKAVYPDNYPEEALRGTKKYQEFSDSKKIAFDLNRHYWENAGKTLMFMGAKDVSPSVWIFNMKNRFKWRDNVDVTTDGKKVDTLNGLLGLLQPTKAGSDQGSTE
jgi:DNA-binding transcriptional regulator YiaG